MTQPVWRPRRLPERPRLWTLDWIEVPSGARRDFNGLQAAWVGKADLSGVNLQQKGGTAYKPTTIGRKTDFGFSTGKPVFILEDPQGKSWVIKSACIVQDELGNTYDLAGPGYSNYKP